MTLRLFAVALLVLVAGFALCTPTEAAQPDLFANYYAYPHAGGIPAQMYLSPYPTPPIAGRTYITYQPLMPHEFLYCHHRNYYTYHPTGGHTHTRVCWW